MSSPDKQILLCGVGPVPFSSMDRLYAPGLRLIVFARALLHAGCRVDMLELRFGETQSGGGARLHTLRPNRDWKAEESSPYDEFLAETRSLPAAPPAGLVREALAAKPYDAIVSSCDVINTACAEAAGETPLWCDFNGHPMTERQGLSYVHNSDEGLVGQWNDILPALLRADRFSAVSPAQRHALLGELGACGRLNRFTDGYPLVSSLPLVPVFYNFRSTGKVLRGSVVPEDAFIILWTGGYNTWADVDTLASGLIEAMDVEPRMHYVSTGGAIAGHDEQTFARFREILEASPVLDRCHFIGWVKTDEVPNYYLEADVGICCDRPTLEGELGARNRIMDWVSAALPTISTDLCELTHWLSERQMIDVFPAGDPSALADYLIRHSRNPKASRDRAQQARARLFREHSAIIMFRDMTEWAKNPHRAPDLELNPACADNVPFSFPDNTLARRRALEWTMRGAATSNGAIPDGATPSHFAQAFRALRSRLRALFHRP